MQKVYGNGKSNKEVAMRGQEIQSEENGKTNRYAGSNCLTFPGIKIICYCC